MSAQLHQITDIQLRPKDCAKKLGVSIATFWVLAKKDPDFPRMTRYGSRCTSVSAAALDSYIAKKTQA